MLVFANSPSTAPIPLDHDACLLAANVNPRTGFATDYLNHFNEAIMLLEMLAEMPECLDDFIAWRPKNYREHFATSKHKYRDLALAAYDDADPVMRQRLEALADAMNDILLAAREVLRCEISGPGANAVADIAVRGVKPMVMLASAVINGTEPGQRRAPVPQTVVDRLMAH